jgi:hypothetical protein
MLCRVRLLAWLRSFAVHLFRGGESQIAVASKGQKVIHQEEWSKLPEEERAKWEPVEESTVLWRRKP